MQEIDESLYSRQLYVLGHEAMQKMLQSKVLIIGCDGLAQEIAKNVCLAGVNELHLLDNECINVSEICTSFFFKEEDVGKRRDKTILPFLRELNPYVKVEIIDEIKNKYECVVCVNKPIDFMIEMNERIRKEGGIFIGCQVKGLFAQIFCDFNDSFYIIDPTGENMSVGAINDISEDGVLTLIEKERHNLEDDDLIKITENKEYENEVFEVKVLNPHKLQLKGKNKFVFTQGGIFEQQRKPKVLSFSSLKDCLNEPPILDFDFEFPDKPKIIHNCFLTLNLYLKEFNREPEIRNENDAEDFYKIFEKNFGKVEENFVKLIKIFSKQIKGNLMPIISVIGGFVAQEVLKGCSSKFTPLKQFFYFDSVNLFNTKVNLEQTDDKINQPIIDLLGLDNLKKYNKVMYLLLVLVQ